MEGKSVHLLHLPPTRLIAMKYSGCFLPSAGTSGQAFIATVSDMKQMIQQLVSIRTTNADQVGLCCLGFCTWGHTRLKMSGKCKKGESRSRITAI